MWQVSNALLVAGIGSLALGCLIAALAGFMVTRESISDFAALGVAWSVGIYTAGVVLGGGFLMIVAGLSLMWTTKWDDSEEEQSETAEIEDD